MASHDAAWKRLFSFTDMPHDLLAGFAPREWVGNLDLSTLQSWPADRLAEQLENIPDPERLCEVGDWLFDCDSSEELLDRVARLCETAAPESGAQGHRGHVRLLPRGSWAGPPVHDAEPGNGTPINLVTSISETVRSTVSDRMLAMSSRERLLSSASIPSLVFRKNRNLAEPFA